MIAAMNQWLNSTYTVFGNQGMLAAAWAITTAHREALLEKWTGTPLLGLTGAPGTGKTACSQTIQRLLGKTMLIQPPQKRSMEFDGIGFWSIEDKKDFQRFEDVFKGAWELPNTGLAFTSCENPTTLTLLSRTLLLAFPQTCFTDQQRRDFEHHMRSYYHPHQPELVAACANIPDFAERHWAVQNTVERLLSDRLICFTHGRLVLNACILLATYKVAALEFAWPIDEKAFTQALCGAVNKQAYYMEHLKKDHHIQH